jgi:hypothetical protein
MAAFRQGRRELGSVEGRNVIIEERYAEQRAARLPELAAERVRLKIDVAVEAHRPSPRTEGSESPGCNESERTGGPERLQARRPSLTVERRRQHGSSHLAEATARSGGVRATAR